MIDLIFEVFVILMICCDLELWIVVKVWCDFVYWVVLIVDFCGMLQVELQLIDFLIVLFLVLQVYVYEELVNIYYLVLLCNFKDILFQEVIGDNLEVVVLQIVVVVVVGVIVLMIGVVVNVIGGGNVVVGGNIVIVGNVVGNYILIV